VPSSKLLEGERRTVLPAADREAAVKAVVWVFGSKDRVDAPGAKVREPVVVPSPASVAPELTMMGDAMVPTKLRVPAPTVVLPV
jgi:hypothetical protein